MIREGWARLVTTPSEVMDELGEAGQKLKSSMNPKESRPGPGAVSLDKDQAVLIEALGNETVEIDQLSHDTGLPIPSVQGHLTCLQICGLVERLPANRVRRKPIPQGSPKPPPPGV